MNTNEILKALNIQTFNGKEYAAKLSGVYKLIIALSKLSGYKIEVKEIRGNLEIINSLPILKKENFRHDSDFFNAEKKRDELKRITGEFQKWQSISILHDKGHYDFNLPMGNEFYYKMCNLLGICYESEKVEKIDPTFKIVTSTDFFECIKKAEKFVSKDELRPTMQCICLDFSDKGLQVAATDATAMYYSRFLNVESKIIKDMQILIAPNSIKSLCKIKVDYSRPVNIHVYKNHIEVNGIECDILNDCSYPDYKCVIPEYTTKIIFDRKIFINKVKEVKLYANGSTNQVNLYMNGQIELSAQDVDFSFEAKARMNYLTKDFEDTTIGFNGNYLINVLNIFKEDNSKMFTNGQPTKSVIFTNDIDNVLLMPLMLNY